MCDETELKRLRNQRKQLLDTLRSVAENDWAALEEVKQQRDDILRKFSNLQKENEQLEKRNKFLSKQLTRLRMKR